MSTSSPAKPINRKRSSSVTQALKQIPLNQQRETHPAPDSEVKPLPGRTRPRKKADDLPDFYRSRGFLNDLKTGRWMLVPSTSFILTMIPVILHIQHKALTHFGILDESLPNPFAALIFPSGQVAGGRYAKSWGDISFVLYYVVFWSFVRQFSTIHILRPLAKRLGIKGSKIERFTEQGYAVMYFSVMGTMGIWVMSTLPIWWFKTVEFWINYPQRTIQGNIKTYYLIQFAYWLQQTIILAGRIEKPRKDFKELVAHHMVTLWLIGWSYTTYMTYIGICVFVTMDVSDIFLGFAKCVNYVNEKYSAPPFAVFVVVWTYMRHYLNIKILYTVYYDFNLIPEAERQGFRPSRDEWMAPWLQWQIFGPILFLQLINLFWYALILRILYRAIFSSKLADERSDDEDEGEQSTSEKVATAIKGSKVE